MAASLMSGCDFENSRTSAQDTRRLSSRDYPGLFVLHIGVIVVAFFCCCWKGNYEHLGSRRTEAPYLIYIKHVAITVEHQFQANTAEFAVPYNGGSTWLI